MTSFDPSRPFGVVCHDAGGTNQIIAMLKEYSWTPEWVVAKGPANAIWRQSFPDAFSVTHFSWLEDAVGIITSTGWASDLEHKARKLAGGMGVLSVAVMDHWTNFSERFVRHGQQVLPDEFWVMDEYAEQIVRSTFPCKPVVLHEDCYARHELMRIAPLDGQTPLSLLYLLEPIRSDWGRPEPGEFQALRFFLERLPVLDLPLGTKILLRLHPSEEPGKYAAFMREEGPFPVQLATGSLTEELSRCRWVAGCQTYAMTIALRSGRQVFGSLPPWAPSCVLPHQGITHLKDMMAA